MDTLHLEMVVYDKEVEAHLKLDTLTACMLNSCQGKVAGVLFGHYSCEGKVAGVLFWHNSCEGKVAGVLF